MGMVTFEGICIYSRNKQLRVHVIKKKSGVFAILLTAQRALALQIIIYKTHYVFATGSFFRVDTETSTVETDIKHILHISK